MTPPVTPPDADLVALIEALIFASDEPLTIERARTAFADGEPTPDEITLAASVEALNRSYDETGRAFRIVTVAGGYQVATRPAYATHLGRMLGARSARRLSQAALETLAIIAYRQPIAKAEIEQIRGVGADYAVRMLLERDLVTVAGRAEGVGRPLLYGTTAAFLAHFGLNRLGDLPKPREIGELLGADDLRQALAVQLLPDPAPDTTERDG